MHVNKLIVSVPCFFLLMFISAFADNLPSGDVTADVCAVITPPLPLRITAIKEEQASIKEAINHNKEIFDIGTDIVNNEFFQKPETFYNFLQLGYGSIDKAIAVYRAAKGLDDRAIFLVFKGGNVLRVIAKRTFELLPKAARDLIEPYYEDFFKRSDFDFSVYIDESKLKNIAFNTVYDDIASLIFEELNKLREKFTSDPKSHFDLIALEKEDAEKRLREYLSLLKKSEAVKDPNNKKWFGVSFNQLQLRDKRAAQDGINCPYLGGFDFQYTIKDKNRIEMLKSQKPNWIVNTDNRTIEFPWGSDPNKRTKFTLVRSRVFFDIAVKKNEVLEREDLKAELLDYTLISNEDSSLRPFLEHYDQNIAVYEFSLGKAQHFEVKAYSVPYLAHDLISIFFDSNTRPWNIGSKYTKRVNRFFLLSLIELLANFGIGSQEIGEYIDFVRENLIKPMGSIYEHKGHAGNFADIIETNAKYLSMRWPNMRETNEFWRRLAEVARKGLVEKPEKGDQEGLQVLLKTINKNLDLAIQFSMMPKSRFSMDELYKVDMKKAF